MGYTRNLRHIQTRQKMRAEDLIIDELRYGAKFQSALRDELDMNYSTLKNAVVDLVNAGVLKKTKAINPLTNREGALLEIS